MKDFSINYNSILSELSTFDKEEIIRFLYRKLPDMWSKKYQEMTPTVTNILQFNINGYEYIFDFSSELVTKGIVPQDQAVEDRLVAVFGRSKPNYKKRDKNRIKRFLGPSSKVFGDNYDKGHFIGHILGGGLDVNLFPQRRDINQGKSEQGKVFRNMERYCLKNPGTFLFNRPIYCNRSWRPCIIEYGLLTMEGTLWVERFEN